MNKRLVKKSIIYTFASIALSILISFTYIFFPTLPNSIDDNLRDTLFKIRGEIPNNNSVFIVDIDERSLQELGQWPWSRNKISKILENLTNLEVGLISFDIVFAEEDRTSPHKILKEFDIQLENIPNYDEEFAQTVAKTPTLLGYQFELEKENIHINKKAPKIPAIFVEKNKNPNENYLIEAQGTILNIPLVQDNAYSSGFFNNIPDESGIIRSVPLIISYKDIIYPSLALEVLRVITQTQRVDINYDDYGVKNIVLNDITIPTDRHGRLLVNFRGKEKNFKYISALDIYNNKIKKEDVEGKIALVGTSAAGLLDLRATPFESVYPGVEVHANVIDNILEGDFIYKASWIDGANISIIFALSILVIAIITFTPYWYKPFITISFLLGSLYITYYFLFTKGIVLNIFYPIFTIISATILATLFDYFYEIKQQEAIKEKFASKVSKEVMDKLLKNIDSNEFQAMEKEVTIFFSDIRGFTQISEKMANASNLIKYLNQYMEPMSNIITKYQGTIDKYIGDAIMAYWNAPGDIENHADKAVQASLEQISQLEPLNIEYKKVNKPEIDIGIGLNTGIAVVGEMGSEGRSDYTVIGDAINLGARLESLCKYYNSKLNISNFTKDALKEKYIFRFLDLVTVKGKVEPVEIWQVLGKGEANDELKKELDLYHHAIDLYKSSNFEEALSIFKKLENNPKKTNKKIYLIYIERCEVYIKNPPSNFIGVYEHTSKS